MREIYPNPHLQAIRPGDVASIINHIVKSSKPFVLTIKSNVSFSLKDPAQLPVSFVPLSYLWNLFFTFKKLTNHLLIVLVVVIGTLI